MATKIVTKNSSTASAVPTASDLVQGELAVNVADKRLFTEDNAGAVVELGTSPSTIDINAGTVDGAVIGGTTPAAITGTTVTSTGNIVVTGTVDGRDVATDGTKLDGIEAGATIDQTAAEIKTAYESNADTNAFTDADHTKLNGIEASADVTDTANVTAAGALMDSELTSIASVKALNQGVATGDSPTFVGLTTSGEITANGGIALGDTDKATFGASDDLQIYHDGSNSYISDTSGTGDLYLRGSNLRLTDNDGTLFLFGATNADTRLYYNGSSKLATTSTGIDVTGNMIADGVGIGTSSPASKLHLADTFTVVTFEDTDSTNNSINTITNYEGTMILSVDPNNNSTVTESMRFSMLGAEAMRIDSSGNVGIGTDSPTRALEVYDTTAAHLNIKTGTAGISYLNFGDTDDDNVGRVEYAHSGNSMQFFTAASEAMRISSSGNLLVGGTTVNAHGSFTVRPNQNNGSCIIQMNRANTTATSTVLAFYNNNSTVGTITHNNTGTAYNTSSDQRLKENIADADDAGSKIDSIQVRKYDWKADGSHQDYGMVAQELLEVAPEAVSVPEDSEEMMGVDYSKLVPMLIKEIQSLRNRVAQLETGE